MIPTGINSNGDVVGYFYLSGGGIHAFLWTKSKGTQDLGTLGSDTALASGINDRGEVTGFSHTGTRMAAFIWSENAGMRDLGTLTGGDSFGEAISNTGSVVGMSAVNGGQPPVHAVLWPYDGSILDLGQLAMNLDDSWAVGINGLGQIVGSSDMGNNTNHGFLWTAALGMQDLGTLGGTWSEAEAINDLGQIVGRSALANGSYHPFLWTQNTGMQDLGTLGPNSGYGRAINEHGQVVGDDGNTAFLWTATLGLMDLNTLIPATPIWRLASAGSINAAGQIAVRAYRYTSKSSALVLTPIMSTALASSQNPANSGDPVTFTATVSNLVQGPPPDGEMVTFKEGWRVLAQVPLTAGVASFTTSTLKPGTHQIQAFYSGDTTYGRSKSAILQQVVQP